jgi:hypothetical protein
MRERDQKCVEISIGKSDGKINLGSWRKRMKCIGNEVKVKFSWGLIN